MRNSETRVWRSTEHEKGAKEPCRKYETEELKNT